MEHTLTALFSIIIMDLALAGDNALVIALAANRLPAHQQKKAILWGALAAVFIRALATIAVVWLLEIPGLLFIGGLILLYIACKLLNDNHNTPSSDDSTTQLPQSDSFLAAVKTIVIADVMMGLDNVLAMAGAAQGHWGLIIVGLLITVPIIMFGSTLCAKLMNRFPAFIWLGAGVLAYTAAVMITGEPHIKVFISSLPSAKYAIIIISMAGVFASRLFRAPQQ